LIKKLILDQPLKTNILADKPTSINLLGPKILIFLYALIPLVPRFEAVDPIGSQWVYMAVISLLGLGFLFSDRQTFTRFSNSKMLKIFFGLYGLFALVSVVSLIGVISLSEGIKDVARIFITLIATVNVYLLFKSAPKSLFSYAVKVLHFILLVIGLQVIFHFLSNMDVARSTKLLAGTNLSFGNRNVTAATMVIQLPFIMWGLVKHTSRWKIISIVTFFVGFTAIFYIGARSALLSAVLIFPIFLGYIVIDGVRKNALSQKLKYPLLPFVGVLLLSFLLVTNTNRIQKSQANSYKNILSTPSLDENGKLVLATETNTKSTRSKGFDNGRLMYFEMAMDDFKANPLLGVGVGNWKMSNKDKYFAASTTDKFLYPLRVHSDFLQVLAETGIMGFVPYLLMFVVLVVILFGRFFSSQNEEERWIYLILILALMAYGVDASLNFPMERTPVQGMFVIIVGLILTLGLTYKEGEEQKENTVSPIILGVLLAIGLGAMVLTYMKYTSYVNQNYILADTAGKNLMKDKYTYSYNQALGRLKGFFNIAGVGRPNEHVKGMYAMSEGRLDEALGHLDKSIAQAPNHYESRMLKAIIYGQRRINNDSCIFYAKQGFEKYPAIKNNYVLLLNAYRAQNDTVNYFKTYDARLARFPDDVSQWKAKSKRVMEFYKDPGRAAAVIDEAIKANPEDTTLETFKEQYTGRTRQEDIRAWYKKGFDLIKADKRAEAKIEFLKILEVTPSNNPTLLNLGIIEIRLKQYEEAVTHLTKVIEAKAFKDGRPEYNRGLAYERLGDKEKAAKDYRRSKALGYSLAKKLPESKLK